MIADSELLQLIKSSPERGLEEMMDSYIGYVFSIIHGRLADSCAKEDIEECVSDVFCDIYRHIGKIDLKKGSLKAFIAVVAKRKAIDLFRKAVKECGNKSLNDGEYDTLPAALDTEKVIVKRETRAELIREIKALGEPDSEIFIRKYYFGQSTKLIAKALRLKANTVDKKVSRGLVKLKEAFGGVE